MSPFKGGPHSSNPPPLSSYPGLSSLASTAQAPEVLWPSSTRLPTGRTGKLDSCSQEQGDYVSCDLSDRVKEDTRHSVYRPEGSRPETGGKGVMGRESRGRKRGMMGEDREELGESAQVYCIHARKWPHMTICNVGFPTLKTMMPIVPSHTRVFPQSGHHGLEQWSSTFLVLW